MFELRSASVGDTQRIAAALAALARTGDLVILAGEMGAGKTAFAQGFGQALGIAEPITSPTFTLVHTYDGTSGHGGRQRLHHADIYRLGSVYEVDDLAFGELLDDGILLVEWGDVIAAALGDHLLVHLRPDTDEPADAEPDDAASNDVRFITVSATGRAWAQRWAAVESALAEWSC